MSPMASNEDRDPVLDELIGEWNAIKLKIAEFAPTILRERVLRDQIGKYVFPNPKEGTNKADMPAGWTLKFTHKIDRKVLEPELDANTEQLRKAGINVDTIIRWKPELNTKEYRGLTAEQIKLVDSVLDIKPATPTLELVPPKVDEV